MDHNSRRRRKSYPEIEEETSITASSNETATMCPLQKKEVENEGEQQQLGQTSPEEVNLILKNSSRMVQEATTTSGTEEKAGGEAKVASSLKQELDMALFNQGFAAEQRLAHLHSALKECMRQINTIQKERAKGKGAASQQSQSSTNSVRERKSSSSSAAEQEDNNHKLKTTTTETGSLTNYSRMISSDSISEAALIVGDQYQNQVMMKSPQGNNTTSRQINLLVDQLCEEENNALRDVIASKDKELRSSKLKCAQTATRLAQVEAQLKGKITATTQLPGYNNSPLLGDQSSCTIDAASNGGDKNVDSESQATPPLLLLTELERSQKKKRNENDSRKTPGTSRMSLINHFVQETLNEAQEKLAMEEKKTDKKNLTAASGDEEVRKEIVPVVQQQGQVNLTVKDRNGDWPWNALQMIVDKHIVSKRSVRELLDDVISALAQSCPEIISWETTSALRSTDVTGSPFHKISEYIILSEDGLTDSRKGKSRWNKSICRIIQQPEGTSSSSSSPSFSAGSSNSCAKVDGSVQVFQWRRFELMAILREFVLTCSHLLSSMYGAESFALLLKATLELTLDKCIIALQDPSRLGEKYRRSFDVSSDSGDENVLPQMIQIRSNLQELNKGRLIHEEEESTASAANRELKRKLNLMKEENGSLTNQLQESKQTIESLYRELEELRETQQSIKDHIENLRTINEDLDTQLTVARSQLNETLQMIPTLEVELEDKSNSCRELESVCLELQLQLEIGSGERSQNHEDDHLEENLATGRKMKVAPSKLSKHQEAIQAVESVEEEAVIDAVLTSITNKKNRSLNGQMLADKDQTKEIILSIGDVKKHHRVKTYTESAGASLQRNCSRPRAIETNDEFARVAVVPIKQQLGANFKVIRKLFWRKRKSGTKTKSIVLHKSSSRVMR